MLEPCCVPAHSVYCGSCLGVMLQSEVCTDRSTNEHVRHELLLKRCRAPNIIFITQSARNHTHWRTTQLEAPKRKHNVPSHRLLAYRPVSDNCVCVPLHLENHVTTPYSEYFVRPPQRHRTFKTIRKTNYHNNALCQKHTTIENSDSKSCRLSTDQQVQIVRRSTSFHNNQTRGHVL